MPPIELPSIPHLPLINVILRFVEGLCAFLALALIARTCAIESHYYGGSTSTPSWTLFVGLYSFLVVSAMVGIPFIYDRTKRCKGAARFLIKPRSTFVLTVFNLALWFIVVITLAVYTADASHCAVVDGDPANAIYGPAYPADMANACSTAKASEAFAWIGFLAWLFSFGISGKIFYDEKQAGRRHLKPDNMSFMHVRDDASLNRSNTHATARSEDLESQGSPYADHAQNMNMVQMYPLPHDQPPPPPLHDYHHEQEYNQPILSMPVPMPVPSPEPAPIPPPHPTGYIPGSFAQPDTGYIPGPYAQPEPGYVPGPYAQPEPGYVPGPYAQPEPGYVPGPFAQPESGGPKVEYV